MEQEIERGVRLIESIAGTSCPYSASILSQCYRYGYGKPKCIAIAIDYFHRSVKGAHFKNNRDAHYALATIYEEGEGVPVDMQSAACHYVHAANSFHAEGMLKAGLAFESGTFGKKDLSRALYYYEMAA